MKKIRFLVLVLITVMMLGLPSVSYSEQTETNFINRSVQEEPNNFDKVQADKDKKINIGIDQITELNNSTSQESIWVNIKSESETPELEELAQPYTDAKILKAGNIKNNLNDFDNNISTLNLIGSIYEIEPNYNISLADNIHTNYAIIGTITDYYYDLDYYRLQVNQSGILRIVGAWMGDYHDNGWEDDLAIGLFDSNDNNLKWSSYIRFDDGSACQALDYSISPGTYYIVVFQSSDYKYLYVGEAYGFSVQLEGIPVQSVRLNKSSTTLTVGDTETLTATVYPTNATNKNVIWTSSHPGIATVSNGVIMPVSSGSTVITVTTEDGGFTAQCNVTVINNYDMNDDGLVNLLDLLWISGKIGQATTDEARKADVNNDGQVNVLDLLEVEQKIAPTDSSGGGVLTGEINYALIKKFGTENGDDVAYIIDKTGAEQTLNIEDATILCYATTCTTRLKLGDFISYDVDASGEADMISILSRASSTGNFFDLALFGDELEKLKIDKLAVVTVSTSSSSSIKDSEDKYYLVNRSTVIFQNFDTNLLKVVSGVSSGQTIMLIDTDDDGGAYDYVIIGIDN